MQFRSSSEVIVLTKSMVHLLPEPVESSFVEIGCADEDACVEVVAAYLPERRSPRLEHYLRVVQEVTADW